MCCCGQPNVNGQPGYSWDGKSFSTHPAHPPTLGENETLVYDEPGRCGGLDAHSHHFCLARWHGSYVLLVKHGGGEERIRLPVTFKLFLPTLAAMESAARYWLLHSLYSAHRDAATEAHDVANAAWRKAAAEKRIKLRRRRGCVYVNIEAA